MSKALPFFHAMTGCDTVFQFSGKRKKTAEETWKVFPEATPVFLRLSSNPKTVSDEYLTVLEIYVVLLYQKTSSKCIVNVAWQVLFAQGSKTIGNIPPTKDAFVQQIK